MKHIIFYFMLVSFLFLSCKKANLNEGVPSYISIPTFELVTEIDEGSNSHKITDAWIYFDNNLQGIYPLPSNFPVLLDGKQNIKIKAGIKNNGTATTRIKYPFYNYYIEEILLKKDSTTILKPTFNYLNGNDLDFVEIEDFEDAGTIFSSTSRSDTSLFQTTDSVFGTIGAVNLAPPHQTFEMATEELQLTSNNLPIYVELNYKANTTFQVGVFANYSEVVETFLEFTINPKNEWNKIYLELTPIINATPNANSYKIFITMSRDINTSKIADLYLDNFKIVCFE